MSLLLTAILAISTSSANPVTFPSVGIKSVQISVPKGKISLSSSKTQKDISIEVTGPKTDDKKKCNKSIGIADSQFFVKISSENILFEKADCDFDVSVITPAAQELDMDISSGSALITIKDINGALNLKTATGMALVNGDALKNITAKTATGDIIFQYKNCPGRADLDFLSATGKMLLKIPASCKIRVDYTSATGKLFNAIGESKDYQILLNAKSASGDLSIEKSSK